MAMIRVLGPCRPLARGCATAPGHVPAWLELAEEKRMSRDNMQGREAFNTAIRRAREGSRDQDDELGLHQSAIAKEIAHLGRQRRWQEALQVFAAVPDPSTRLRTAIMDTCVRSLQFQLARRIFDEMPMKTLPAYSVYISMLGRERRTTELEDVRAKLSTDGHKLNTVTYGSLVSAFGAARSFDSMFNVLAEMKEACLNPGPVVYGGAMAACAKAGDYAQVAQLMQELESSGAQADIGHFTSLVVACARSKNEALAREAFTQLRQRGLQPDVVLYTSLLGCLGGPDALQKAEALLEEMKSSNIQPDIFVYNSVAKAALVAKEPDRCRELLGQATAMGLKENQETSIILQRLQKLEEQLRMQEEKAQLPQGWLQHLDPATGAVYYWRADDPAGTTTWQRPI
eukprot:TRINITY_DN75766_c0_g1_i1.p1 TRINITY_DN75766_c0_g1~~TRINITY_DN75766_c0_g1_i1.p1  ORF type:complete len:400 (-),score=92.95 TRINITY_DN75766_c0_g1_i1:24-1223(-)